MSSVLEGDHCGWLVWAQSTRPAGSLPDMLVTDIFSMRICVLPRWGSSRVDSGAAPVTTWSLG